jgi:HK97 family phage prohead protease
MNTEYFFATVKALDTDSRTLEAVASTKDKDRDGDIILPSAFKDSLTAFMANPVILAGHQHKLSSGSSPVIGSAVPESIKITDDDVIFRMRFAETPLGEEYWQLYKDGHMKAFSIGFIPEKWEDSKDSQSRFGTLRTYTQIELLEISAVPVPSNRRALARVRGYFDDKDDITKEIRELVETSLKKSTDQLKNKLLDELDEIKTLLTDSESFAAGLLGTAPDPNDPAGKEPPTEQDLDNYLNKLN